LENNIAVWCEVHRDVHKVSTIFCFVGMELSMSIGNHGLSKRIPYDKLPDTKLVVELDNMYRVLASLVNKSKPSC